MGPPQVIRTPNGEELVILPRAEYERQREAGARGPGSNEWVIQFPAASLRAL